MRDYKFETEKRVAFIQDVLRKAGAEGIVYGNSGGKDSALVGALCKAACENTVGIIMPCESKRNYTMDKKDGLTVVTHFGIETREVDITPVKEAAVGAIQSATELTDMAKVNINPRLRMMTLYAIAASENRLVAGTGNRSEAYLGYFTKWGDGAYDFNPIADLTVTEIYEFLEYLNCPRCVIDKAPSAGLFDGQTDESEMGIGEVDSFLLTGTASAEVIAQIGKRHTQSEHKRQNPPVYHESDIPIVECMMKSERNPILNMNQHEEMQIETPKVDPLYEKAFLKSDEKEASPYSANTTAWD